MNDLEKKYFSCPVCNKQALLDSSNAFRPFCSERCKIIDLGEWASGTYNIVEPATSEIPKTDIDDPEEED